MDTCEMEGLSMKKVFGILAFLSFMMVFGTVGAIEQDMISLARGIVQGAIGLICMDVFCRFAGAYDPYYGVGEDDV